MGAMDDTMLRNVKYGELFNHQKAWWQDWHYAVNKKNFF